RPHCPCIGRACRRRERQDNAGNPIGRTSMRISSFGVRAAFPAALALSALFSSAAQAVLKVGDAAPAFTTQAAVAGKPFAFNLETALRKGPVVLYFFPKAFTEGCTLEAHAFAEATPQFNALGAQVVGMSHDDIATLQRFSTEACRDQFAVASDPQARTIQA